MPTIAPTGLDRLLGCASQRRLRECRPIADAVRERGDLRLIRKHIDIGHTGHAVVLVPEFSVPWMWSSSQAEPSARDERNPKCRPRPGDFAATNVGRLWHGGVFADRADRPGPAGLE
jgi:hypothetical protein